MNLYTEEVLIGENEVAECILEDLVAPKPQSLIQLELLTPGSKTRRIASVVYTVGSTATLAFNVYNSRTLFTIARLAAFITMTVAKSKNPHN